MKKVYLLLLVAGMFTFVACGGGETEATTEEAATEEAATEEAATEELAEHVCNDQCTEEACHFACGEKGHTCSDACHSHEEGDDHDHSGEEEADAGAEG